MLEASVIRIRFYDLITFQLKRKLVYSTRLTFQILTKLPETEDGVKAALRDLDLKVNLKEEWNGEQLTIKKDFRETWD